jgi:hypothetical protein
MSKTFQTRRLCPILLLALNIGLLAPFIALVGTLFTATCAEPGVYA